MSERLFNEFEPVSAKQWKQKIQFDLKGADYNETLVWDSPEGLRVKPFYHQDGQGTTHTGISASRSWKICQKIYVANEIGANKKALDVLSRGAESLWFVLPSAEIDLLKLFHEIDVEKTTIHLEPQFISASFVKKLANYFDGNNKIYLHSDVIGNLAKNGNWFSNLESDHSELKETLKLNDHFESSISVDMALYQNAGANMVQQLAYGMAHATEYLNFIGDQHPLSNVFTIRVAVGSNYFFEIAKLRAFRLLWKTIATEFGFNTDCHILTCPTKRNKTLYDYNTNMLRTTTECMSAILGQANTVCNLPYDAIYHKDNEFGERISRNQLLILKAESYLDKVHNPADGAYYIEELTQELAQNALDLFKDIEANGGFLKQLKEGTIQRKIKESAQKEQERFDKGEEILIGTNKYPNDQDRMKDTIELYPFVKKQPRKTLITPIIEKRLSEKLEQERLEKENS